MNRWAYRPELDGLRSVAVYLVLLFHSRVSALSGGFIGVDVFFVLSGFLVSHVIWAEVDRAGTFRLGWFYARRVRRLLPAAVLVIVATAAMELLVTGTPARDGMVRDGQSALVYLANWQFVADSRDYFAAGATGSNPFLHFWSLSIEEQFYIGLPLLLLLLGRLRRQRALVPLVLGGVVVVSVGCQVWYAHTDPTYAFYATHARIYQLAAGVLLALLTRRREVSSAIGAPLAIVGVLAVLVAASPLVAVTPSTRGFIATGASLLAILGLYAAPGGPAARVLALPLPRYLGQISYGTYLWHWPLILVLRQVFHTGPLVVAALAAGLASGLAALSYQVFERPIRRAAPLDHVRWPIVGTGLAASVLAAVLVLPSLLHADVRPAAGAARPLPTPAAAARASWADDPIPGNLDLTGALHDIPDAGTPCTADDLSVCVSVQGHGPRILVVGDSQAQMFLGAFESLARDHDLTLLTNVIAGCGWQAGTLQDATPAEQAHCDASRAIFYRDVLPQLHVDVVVTLSLARADASWVPKLTEPGGPPGETLAQIHLRTETATADLIHRAGARLVMVKALLGTHGYLRNGPDPLDCLARATTLGQCAVVAPLQKPFTDGILDAIAASSPDDTATTDLNPVLCPDYPVCRPVAGRTVVWKDPDHVTATYLEEQRARIWRRLTATGLVDR